MSLPMVKPYICYCMNLFRYILLFSLTFLLFTQKVNAQSQTRYTYHDGDSSNLKEVFSVKEDSRNILEGKYISYYLNGNIESEGQFQSNDPVGEWKFYYETGKLKMKMEVLKPEEGLWQYFYESGVKSMEGRIVKNKREGNWKLYYENGALKSTGDFLNNRLDGPWQFYFEDGKLKGEAEYMGGKGLYKEYYPTGELRAEGPKSAFNNAGRWKYYFKEGQKNNEFFIQAEGNYINGKKTGEWQYFFLNGQVSSKGSYINDLPSGKWSYFYEDGSLSSTGEYEEGMKNGNWNLFFYDGKKKGTTVYNNGTGEYTEYYRDQKIKVTGFVVDGQNHGMWKYYYPSGVLEGECEFAYGKGVYYGYYPDGTLQTKGIIKEDKKIGTWELYENDGTLSGYYKPYYDQNGDLIEVVETETSKSRKPKSRIYRSKARGFRYFDSRINEFHGIIVSANPFLSFVGRFPLGVEFYVQERIGHEFEFEGIRKPFFASGLEIPLDEVFSRGYSISLRQKFYNEAGNGLWYFGHELQFSSLNHNANILLPGGPEIQVKVSASEYSVRYHILTGYRLMESTVKKGFTVDIFGGIGVGFRHFDVDEEYSASFDELPQGQFPFSYRLGFNLGYTIAYDRW